MTIHRTMRAVLMTAILAAGQSPNDIRFGIEGTVLDAQSGKPIPQALVTVFWEEQNPQSPRFAILTDPAGSFQVRNIPAGTYRLQASRGGYIDPSVRGFSSRSTQKFTPEVSTQDRTSKVKLFLSRQAVIEGTVLDSAGRPVLGLVEAFRTVVRQGKYRLEIAQEVSVDRAGAFRLVGLQPGKYHIGISPGHPEWMEQFQASLYPGVSTLEGARVFEIAPGVEEQIHFRLASQPSYKVRGTIPVDVSNGLEIHSLTWQGVPFHNFFPYHHERSSGTVSASGLFPGDYVLSIYGGGSISSQYFFHVGEQDELNLNFVPLSPIHGTVRLEQSPPPISSAPAEPVPRRSQATPFVSFSSAARRFEASVDGDGHFMSGVIVPGVYDFDIFVTPPRYVKSAYQGRRDLLRENLIVTNGAAEPIEIVIGEGAARLAFTVANYGEEPPFVNMVGLRSVGGKYRMESSNILNLRAAPNGGTIPGLPPGEYLFFAWNADYGELNQLPYNEEAFLRKYSPLAQRVTVYASEDLSLVLEPRLPPAVFDVP